MKGIRVMSNEDVIASKGQELLDHAKEKYGSHLSMDSMQIGPSMTMHNLHLNGVHIGLAVRDYTLGIHADYKLLHEAAGACAPVLGKKGFLVFGAHDLAGELVNPFFTRVYWDGVMQHVVGEERVEQVEALFRMLLVLAIGW